MIHIQPNTLGASLFHMYVEHVKHWKKSVRTIREQILRHFFNVEKEDLGDAQDTLVGVPDPLLNATQAADDAPTLLIPSGQAMEEGGGGMVAAPRPLIDIPLSKLSKDDANAEKVFTPQPKQVWVPSGAALPCEMPFEYDGGLQDACVRIGEASWCPNVDGIWGTGA